MRMMVVMVLVLGAATSAWAVSGAGAILLQFDTSVRSEGMGGAGVAAFWGEDPDMWANPANIAHQRGLRYAEMESQLVPDLADDIWLTDKWLAAGFGGVGVFFARGPVDGARLDMGDQEATNDAGEVIGTFEAWSTAERMGLGVSLFEMLESLGGAQGRTLSRLLDVSAGYTHIEYEDHLVPDPALQDQMELHGDGTAASYGAQARLTPLDTRGTTGAAGPLGGVRLDLVYGMSVLNRTDDFIEHVDADQQDPFPRMHVRGWSLHVETGFPPALRDALGAASLDWLADSLTPLVSFGYAEQTIEPGLVWDAETFSYSYEHDTSGEYDEESWGWELSIANIYSYRKGHRTYSAGQIDGDTEGHSLGFKIAGIGGVRWDKATVPQATGLMDVEREGWTIWADLSRFLN